MRKIYWYLLVLAACALALAACGPQTTPAPTPVPCPTAVPCPDCPTAPDCPKPAVEVIPNQDLWAGSDHADKTAMAFNDWNDADPKEIPASCAKCHSTPGYLDYIGADGTEANKTDNAAPIGTVIECQACHNDVTEHMTSVLMPSGVELTGLGPESRCMQCHQGRFSGPAVDKAVASLTDPDVVSPTLGFKNIHYLAAAATLYGTQAKGGYEYAGQLYDPKFAHVEGIDTCVDCHNPHSLEVRVEKCAECHTGVTGVEDLKNVRMVSSAPDYDGDGNVTEGVYYEIQGLQELLLQNIQAYANEIGKAPITYSETTYPYFLGADGKAYAAWTARLLEAAYNYQVSIKDPGAFAHNGKYIIELLYDSIASLNEKVATPIDMSKMNREDAGHFRASAEAFRHWDEEGEVSASCARCHSSAGLPMFIKNGALIAVEPTSGMLCTTCHDEANFPARYAVNSVTMPSGKSVSYGENADSNICVLCHQGRQSKKAVDAKIAQFKAADAPDTVVEPIQNADGSTTSFGLINAHYLGIAAVWFGSDAAGFYEYDGKTYVGTNPHMPVDGKPGCVGCHDAHSGVPKEELCAQCHGNVAVDDIRGASDTADYNGNGDVTEGVRAEYRSLRDVLYAEIQKYAKEKVGTGIVYDSETNPYWFVDADGDGKADLKDGKPVSYSTLTPRLLKATYNFNFIRKNPGAAVHNAKYIIQIIFDTIEDLGGDVSTFVRP